MSFYSLVMNYAKYVDMPSVVRLCHWTAEDTGANRAYH